MPISDERNRRWGTSKFVRDEKPAVKTEQKVSEPTQSGNSYLMIAKSAEVIKEASDLIDKGSDDNHSANSVPFLIDDRRGPVPSFDFPKKERKTRRRQLYEEASNEHKDKSASEPEDASYTQSL